MSFLTCVCMHTSICLHVGAPRRLMLAAVGLKSGKGTLSGILLAWKTGWPCGGSEERVDTHLGVRASAPGVCYESPACPGSRSPQDALGVPSMAKTGFEV